MASEAGLTPGVACDLSCAFEYADEETLARRMLAAGLVVELTRAASEEVVRDAVLRALEPYRASDGSYRLENEWHYLVASA